MIKSLAKLFNAPSSRRVDALSRQVADLSLESVCLLVGSRVESMTFSEARGYVRARAARIVRKQAWLAINRHPGGELAWIDAVARAATEADVAAGATPNGRRRTQVGDDVADGRLTMDTDEYPSLPNLQQMHARLAANSRRVASVISSQLDGIERLFTATTTQDWKTVAEVSRLLAEAPPEVVGQDVVREARQVFEELRHAPDGAKQPKHLSSLLAACREAKRK